MTILHLCPYCYDQIKDNTVLIPLEHDRFPTATPPRCAYCKRKTGIISTYGIPRREIEKHEL